jgi:transcriptional regulator with XRE-family HTH domain
MSTLGDRLRAARERLGITQIRAGQITGINPKTLGGYERGVSEPDALSLAKLAQAYGVTVDYLVTGENPLYKETSRDLGELLTQMDLEFEGVRLKDDVKERIKEMIKLMIYDDIQKQKNKEKKPSDQ